MSIDRDRTRFKNIIKGQVKSNLRDYISRHELVGQIEKDTIKIPIHKIEIPHFKFGSSENEQVGMGEGPGTGKPGEPQEGSVGTQAGTQESDHETMEFTVEEVLEILQEELNLPRIQPKGTNTVILDGNKYSTRRPQGPEGLKHFKSTYKKSLQRLISGGDYNPKDPKVIPIKADKIYKAPKVVPKPFAQAVIFYLMDVSGSMGDEQKNIVKTEIFWINAWLKKHYPKLDSRFIIHDAKAQEVDDQTFFTTTESGGTMISSAYELAKKIIKSEYPVSEWNIYLLHFSDGDNGSGDDTLRCIKALQNDLLPVVNLFGYGQVSSRHGSGGFFGELEKGVGKHEKVVLSHIHQKEDILKSIREILGKGR